MMEFPDIEITISQYDHSDCEIGRYTGTFTTVFDSIPDFERYYYRVTALGHRISHRRVSTLHFGVRTTSIGNFNLSEEWFINSFLNAQVQDYFRGRNNTELRSDYFSFSCDLIHDFWYHDRMRTLGQNTPEGFQAALQLFLNDNPCFQEIDNLKDVKCKEGIYLLVLDNYNVCYLGQSNDIRQRVMRHWSRNDYFSGTGIDMFKAKDTTRIFVAFTNSRCETNSLEHHAVNSIPSRYTLNCISGGDIDYLESNSLSLFKRDCTDEDYVYYVLEPYDATERINSSLSRFVVNS